MTAGEIPLVGFAVAGANAFSLKKAVNTQSKTRNFILTLQWGKGADIFMHTTQLTTDAKISFDLINKAAEKVGALKGQFVVLALVEMEE